MNQNRRKFIRISADGTNCQVTIGQRCSPASLINESIYGLCVGGLDLMFLALDQPVIVKYEDQEIVGRCRSASKDSNGAFQIGILKSENDFKSDVQEILINSYMDFGGHKIVCLPLGMQPDGKVKIRLIDGKEFDVDKSKITQMTRAERKAQLNDGPDDLGKYFKIYSVLSDRRFFSNETDILEIEFGMATGRSLVSA
jgi:hypothetical protein